MEKVIIFGMGYNLKRILMKGMLAGYEVLAYCDNDRSKWGKYYNNIEIISPEKLNEYIFDKIIISTEKYAVEIERQLIENYKIPTEQIVTIDIAKDKYEGELDFWRVKYEEEQSVFRNDHYKDLMLAIAEEKDDKFWENKVVADFGCGPRGSLRWTKTPRMKIGIDVLVPRYLQEFGDNMIAHEMVYVASSEKYIPLPDNSVDVLVTINALDHVSDLESICNEMLRILKPQGILLASFNLNEPKSECEPQTLTESLLKEGLLNYFNINTYRLAYTEEKDAYLNLKNNKLLESIEEDKKGVLWVKATKK